MSGGNTYNTAAAAGLSLALSVVLVSWIGGHIVRSSRVREGVNDHLLHAQSRPLPCTAVAPANTPDAPDRPLFS